MSWTTPRAWVTGELVTASLMNTHVRDNLNALKAPPTDHYEPNEASNYTTTNTSFEDVDATNLALTITTTGGDVLVHFHGVVADTAGRVHLDVLQTPSGGSGVRVAGDDGMVRMGVTNEAETLTFTRLIAGLAAGTYTFSLQWKVNAGTGTMYAGAGTSGLDLHPQFWVREI